MGSGNSRLGGSPPPTPPQRPKVNRTKHRFSSLFCGVSSSQREDHAGESLVSSTDHCQQFAKESQIPTNVSLSTFTGDTEFTSHSNASSGPNTSTESSSRSVEHVLIENDSHIESSDDRKWCSESEEILLDQTTAESKNFHHRLGDNVSAPCMGQLPQLGPNSTGNTINSQDVAVSSDMPSFFEEIGEVVGNHNTESSPIPSVSDLVITSQSREDEVAQEVVTPGLGLLVSDRAQARPEGSLLHVDVVSVSSNNLPSSSNEVSTREARRNNRRMLWDTLSGRSSRRHAEYPALLLTAEDAEFTGSRRRWLLDIGDDIFDDGFGSNTLHLGRRSRFTTDQRRNSRTEFWDRLRGAATESRHRASCPLNLHSDGSCSCELDEEASALSSISRIVLLAEALFEVLDEVHHQPDSFSMSVLSVPAPASVVDSLPLRTYEKPCTTGCEEDVDQCYICLVEYEEGDKIRVLPCRHEYHMLCVDKWLKEIHGICPLCRGEVVREDAASSSDAVVTYNFCLHP